jgi:hypothetical protein
MELLDRPGMLVRALLAARFVAGVLVLGTSASELVPYVLADQVGETDICSDDFEDQFGYRRLPIQHLGGLVAPSEWGGLAAWMNHPAAAASAAGMAEQVATC